MYTEHLQSCIIVTQHLTNIQQLISSVRSQRALRLYCVECQSCSASPRLSTWNVALLMLGAQCFL